MIAITSPSARYWLLVHDHAVDQINWDDGHHGVPAGRIAGLTRFARGPWDFRPYLPLDASATLITSTFT